MKSVKLPTFEDCYRAFAHCGPENTLDVPYYQRCGYVLLRLVQEKIEDAGKDASRLIGEKMAAQQQRDELLAALREARSNLRHAQHCRSNQPMVPPQGFNQYPCDCGSDHVREVATAAIAKAEWRSNEFTKGGGLSSEGDAVALATEETGNDRPAAPIYRGDQCPSCATGSVRQSGALLRCGNCGWQGGSANG